MHKRNENRVLISDKGLHSLFDSSSTEAFTLSKVDKTITRIVSIENYKGETVIPYPDNMTPLGHDSLFDKLWLTTKNIIYKGNGPKLRVVDLFAGCGGLSLGIQAAASALGGAFESVFAADIDEGALGVYSLNLAPKHISSDPLDMTFEREIGSPLNADEAFLKAQCGHIDFLIGGPPCQGHSDLNNHTRRNDPRNDLYYIMSRASLVFEPEYIIIENVLGVRHSTTEVVQRTLAQLNKQGYKTASIALNASKYGVAQSRRRHFTLALKGSIDVLHQTLASLERSERPVMWAIDDLMDESELFEDVYVNPSVHSDINQSRINFLFEHNIYELPNSERPDCHRLKQHTYNSVYGRMRPGQPAPTVTSGFGSTGQGRFVHPFRRRTITPHEAARIQYFPDWFTFGNIGRRQLQKYIGNAVPSKLGYVLGLALLNAGYQNHE